MPRMLHTVNKSPYERDSLATCLRYASAGSDVLLIEDGVYGAMAGGAMDTEVRSALARCRVFALEPDLRARGIGAQRLIDGVVAIGYDGFVELAVANERVQAWLGSIDRPTLAVSHGGVGRVLRMLLLGADRNKAVAEFFPQDRAFVFRDGAGAWL